MMRFFSEAVAAMVIPESPVDSWLDAAAVVLQDDTFENTWSADQGVARRVIWRFNDEFVLQWIVLGGDQGVPSWLQAWWLDPAAHDSVCPLDGFLWDPADSTWMMENATASIARFVLEDAVDRFACEPMVCLPWNRLIEDEMFETAGEFFDRVDVDGGFLDMLGGMDDDMVEEMKTVLYENSVWEVGAEDFSEPVGLQVLLAARLGGVVSAWGVKDVDVVECDAFMPPQSQYVKFVEFMNVMSKKPDWVVVWDECCGTCGGGSRRSEIAERGLPDDAPSLMHFGQQSQCKFLCDGTVDYDFYLDNDDEVAVVLDAAQQVGLRAVASDGRRDGSWVVTVGL